jgi:hypothetical protein
MGDGRVDDGSEAEVSPQLSDRRIEQPLRNKAACNANQITFG